MKEYAPLLERFNLSPTAAKVYIALLELGKATADKIAKRVGTYKANVYDALDRLEEAGLSSYLFEDHKKFFIPTNPEKLPQIVDDIKAKDMEKLDNLRKDITNLMPQLKAKYGSIKEKELFEVYRGRKAYKAVINEILKEKPKLWKGFGNFQVKEVFPIEYIHWFKKVPFRLFSTKTKKVEALKKEAKKTCDVKVTWLPEEVYMPIVWVVFGNNVLIIIYEPDLILMRIKSEQVVKTFSNQFDYLWEKYND
ncbi:MAG: helix-turn-helix domain-containing protein [Candidatus Woesearchaeota archaeon]|jgi:DNA-binding transcriptional ArsR family regulator|nr:helix-turn-helix domain-containing protein [Candidatus Woesearchaeota archaeon]